MLGRSTRAVQCSWLLPTSGLQESSSFSHAGSPTLWIWGISFPGK